MRHFRLINVFFVALLFFTIAAIKQFDYLTRGDIYKCVCRTCGHDYINKVDASDVYYNNSRKKKRLDIVIIGYSIGGLIIC